jgi:uncharacterized membrane protein YfcA
LPEYALTVFLFFLGGIVQGSMGFGMAMIVAPPLLLILPATTIVPAMSMASVFNSAIAAWSLRRHVDHPTLWPLVAGGLVGIPAGIYMLTSLDGPVFKAGVGVLMIALAAMLLSGRRVQLSNPRAALFPVGAASGFLGGSISIGGPPIVLFLTNLGVSRDTFRANLLAYFSITSALAVIGFLFSGVLTRDVAWFALGLIPVVFVGTQLGLVLATRIHHALFERITLVFVAMMGAILLARNVYSLM